MASPYITPMPCTVPGLGWLSTECAEGLQDVCAQSSVQVLPTGQTVTRSVLLDAASPCFTWRSSVQSALATQQAVPGKAAATLDANIQSYCTSHSSAAECTCETFPQRASSYCAANAEYCPSTVSGSCMGRIFQQSTPSGGIEMLQLEHCAPHVCWLNACQQSTDAQLLTINTLKQQWDGCPGLCIMDSSAATTSALPPPLPAQSYEIDSRVLQQCGEGGRPAQLSALGLQVDILSGQPPQTQVSWGNSGDVPLLYTVTSISEPWLGVSPQTGIINPGSTARVSLGFLDASLTTDKTYSASVHVEYTSFGDQRAHAEVPISVKLSPGPHDTTVTRTALPPAALAVSSAGGLLLLSSLFLRK